MMWHVARYELHMQVRTLAFWLVAGMLVVWVWLEVAPAVGGYPTLATASDDALPVNIYAAWHMVDRVGLLLALGVGVLGAFVWVRDASLRDMLHVRPLASWQYTIGKVVGVSLASGSLFVPAVMITGGWAFWRATAAGVPFDWGAFLLPAVGVSGITLLHGVILTLLLSLLLRNGVAALLVYVGYWMFGVSSVAVFSNGSETRILVTWLLRFDFVSDAASYALLREYLMLLVWNRVLFIALTSMLLVLLMVAYHPYRQGEARHMRPLSRVGRWLLGRVL